MTFIKASLLSAISTLFKILTGFVSVKVVSVYIGPSGLALMGQMQNFVTMMSSIASAGVNNGVIKYTAEHFDDVEKKQKIWSTAFQISLILIAPMAFFVILFSDFLSIKLLNNVQYSSVFKIFAVTVVFFVLNGLLTSILNGQKEIKKLTLLNIFSSIFGLLVAVWLVVQYQLYGALIAGIVSQAIVFLITLIFVFNSSWFRLSMFFGGMDKDFRNKLLKYSAMTLVAVTMMPLSQMYVRDYIAKNVGWSEAGYWQAISQLSDVYLMFITTSLSVYYLPKLSGIRDKWELKKEIFHAYKITIPIVVLLAACVYIFRFSIINILFSKAFMPMAELFSFQMIGSVFKIASWLLSYVMVAKAMTRLFILSELIFVWSFVGFVIIFVRIYGLIGVSIAFMVNYLLYMIFLCFFMQRHINEN